MSNQPNNATMEPNTTLPSVPLPAKTGETDFWIGFGLAVSSSLFIGSSFILKKKALLRLSSKEGTRAGAGGHGYLRDWMWWAGVVTMGLGEAFNFIAYAFAPASLVTPLGALSVLVTTILSSRLLHERLNLLGKLGCAICLLGSTVVVLHSPKEENVATMQELGMKMMSAGWIIYALCVLGVAVFLIFGVAPRIGTTNILIYILICSLVGSLSVVGCKGVGLAVKESLEGVNQMGNPLTWGFLAAVVFCVTIQLNYLNKSLDLFNTSIVTPIYYVFFTAFVILASGILFDEWGKLSAPDVMGNLCGFGVIVLGIFQMQLFKDFNLSVKQVQFFTAFVILASGILFDEWGKLSAPDVMGNLCGFGVIVLGIFQMQLFKDFNLSVNQVQFFTAFVILASGILFDEWGKLSAPDVMGNLCGFGVIVLGIFQMQLFKDFNLSVNQVQFFTAFVILASGILFDEWGKLSAPDVMGNLCGFGVIVLGIFQMQLFKDFNLSVNQVQFFTAFVILASGILFDEWGKLSAPDVMGNLCGFGVIVLGIFQMQLFKDFNLSVNQVQFFTAFVILASGILFDEWGKLSAPDVMGNLCGFGVIVLGIFQMQLFKDFNLSVNQVQFFTAFVILASGILFDEWGKLSAPDVMGNLCGFGVIVLGIFQMQLFKDFNLSVNQVQFFTAFVILASGILFDEWGKLSAPDVMGNLCGFGVIVLGIFQMQLFKDFNLSVNQVQFFTAFVILASGILFDEWGKLSAPDVMGNLCGFGVIVLGIFQMQLFKDFNLSVNQVQFFTAFVILASGILFDEWGKLSAPDVMGNLCGFGVIVLGIFQMQLFKDFNLSVNQVQFFTAFVILASGILFDEWGKLSALDVMGNLCGFGVIVLGIFQMQLFKDFNLSVNQVQFFTAFVILASGILFDEWGKLSAPDVMGNLCGFGVIVLGIFQMQLFKDFNLSVNQLRHLVSKRGSEGSRGGDSLPLLSSSPDMTSGSDEATAFAELPEGDRALYSASQHSFSAL